MPILSGRVSGSGTPRSHHRTLHLNKLWNYVDSSEHSIANSTGLGYTFKLIDIALRHVFLNEKPLNIKKSEQKMSNQELSH